VIDFNKIKHMYFLGIGGIGMSALARYFALQGIKISGYDRTPTQLTDELIQEGIKMHFKEDCTLLDKDIDMVVYTPAVPSDHKEFVYFREKQITMKKRSEILGIITSKGKTIAVAGTHGKTTITSLLTHIMISAKIPVTAFIGGITKNYNTNVIINKNSQYTIVEADEFDRSFLALHPDIAVISAMDADHLDIYENKKYLEDSFKLFAGQLKAGGLLFFKNGLPLRDTGNNTAYTYHLRSTSDYYASKIAIDKGKYIFDISGISNIQDITLGLPGLHNVENAIAAIAVAKATGIEDNIIREALSTYIGVKRRFDYIIHTDHFTYIDDYAHHPEEIKACITSVKELFPGKKITGIFQPHLFSRTRDFISEFAESLELLDNLLLLDIYPARELPIEGISSKVLFDKIRISEKQMVQKSDIIQKLETIKPEVLLTMGAGDIDQLVDSIKEHYSIKV
jgi:UDP-N-acetylmuramate--alanine ligase